MTFKHYDVVRAASPSDLAERLTQKIKEGWQPFGSPVAITPYTLMQAIAAEGDVTSPVVVQPSGDGSAVISTTSEPEYYFVVVLGGQSNCMAYGEGLPLPDSYDRPDPRIKQLARRSTVTPGGDACVYNDVIQADHCLHDVQDMSGINHPKADLAKGQYGTVGQGLHIAKKLLPYIPQNAGILLVPCCRGGSAFTTGDEGTFSESTGASADSSRWGAGKPLYQDLLSRTRAALAKNPKNRLLAVVWMQGEADLASGSQQHNGLFTTMVQQFRTDLSSLAAQCVSGNAATVPWICGDTTYYWKNKYATQYEAVYGAYKNLSAQNIFFVPFLTDENGQNTPTNAPAEDPDIVAVGYYGAASRSQGNFVSIQRDSHFSSWARRGIISDRLASAILVYAGRTAGFISGEIPSTGTSSGDTATDTGTTTPGTGSADTPGTTPAAAAIILSADGGDISAQGWTVEGTTVTATANTMTSSGETLAQNVLSIPKQSGAVWRLGHATTDEPATLLNNGGEFLCRFRIADTGISAGRYAFGLYWLPDVQKIPAGVAFNKAGSGMSPSMLNFYVQTDDSDINLLSHCSTKSAGNLKIGSFGAFDNEWHTVHIRYHGGGTARATVTLDNQEAGDITLLCAPSAVSAGDTLMLSSITSGDTYNIEVESLSVTVNG
ncbi:SASA family carbohydrate esterase [Escherichia coli]|uniref:SASA family carbohydrate esterase n=1 Tax=Escherichia coli TaxID=562 RepID=UPI0013156664|nr:SASA family carbohydrate esterase [Escherichia coli]